MSSAELSHLNDGQLADTFRQRQNDPQFLDALNEELKQRHSDEAVNLHIEVAKARRTFLSASAAPTGVPQKSGPVREWLRVFFNARSLTRPDGRALYRYRMTDGEYEQAKAILRYLARSGRLAYPDLRAGALFVAYCAEWFRRESNSTFLRWDDPAPDLFPSVPYSSKQQLTLDGLSYWRRDLRLSGSIREFLLTVALEGGFPVRILTEGARGWLKDYLRSIMSRAISWRVDSHSEILEIAEEQRGRMRKSYQHDDFVALCSELVESLLRLRQEAEVELAGNVRNSTLLDARHPGWRDELPIYVPPEDEALVADLLSGLLDEKMTGLATEGVEARRYLAKRDGEWLPALQLLADGEVPPAKLPSMSTRARVRAIPTGELANQITGEVALFEPPVGEQRRWRVRPFMRTAKLLTNFPFAAPVTTMLSSPDDAPCPWVWPRGEALRSDLLVFQDAEGSTPHEPLLRFLRSGSVSSPAKTLYVLFPDDWTAEPAVEGAVGEIESVHKLGCKLARLTGVAYFTGRETDGIRFRIEPDTDTRERELELEGAANTGFDLADERWEQVVTPIRPLIGEAGKHTRQPSAGELFARRPGGEWNPMSAPLGGSGLMELSWRDPAANIQIEKRLLVLLPYGARVSGTMKDAVSAEIRLEGLPGWSASVNQPGCSTDGTDSSVLSVRFTGRPAYRLPVSLSPPQGQPFNVVVPLIGRDAVVATADGSILSPGARVDVGALRGAVAVSPQRTMLHLTAKGSKSGGLTAVVDGELPFGTLRGAIDETLATMPGQDDLVELEFIGDTRRPIRISRYRHEQLSLESGLVIWHQPSGSSGAYPVAKMILDPRHEHALERETEELWRIPERCTGLCLVYLRDGVDVVSRPVPILRPGGNSASTGYLLSALLIQDFNTRQHEISDALIRLGHDEGRNRDINWLLDAATNLNGLPASAFDALKRLPLAPEALIRLLLSARDAGERGAIWLLQNELPFLWLALPLSAWRTALVSDFAAVVSALEPIFGKEKAGKEALERLFNLRNELIALEPALEAVFVEATLPPADPTMIPTLKELTGAYIRAQDRHRDGHARNDIALRLASQGLKLPGEIAATSHTDFAGLFAPVLLAASARQKLKLERDLSLLARRTLREDPFYVSAAWHHLLRFYRGA